jgi:hypothetical protein
MHQLRVARHSGDEQSCWHGFYRQLFRLRQNKPSFPALPGARWPKSGGDHAGESALKDFLA